MTEKTIKRKRIVVLITVFAMLFTQFASVTEVFAAEAKSNIVFEKNDGSKIYAEKGELKITTADIGVGTLKVYPPSDYQEWNNFEWVKNNNDFLDYKENSGEWGSTTQNLNAKIKKAGEFTATYKSGNAQKTFTVKVEDKKSGYTELRAVINKENNPEEKIANGGSYIFPIADGANAVVTLEGKKGDSEWEKVTMPFTIKSSGVVKIESGNEIYIQGVSQGLGTDVEIYLNTEPNVKMSFKVKGEAEANKSPLLTSIRNAKKMISEENNVYSTETVATVTKAIEDAEAVALSKLPAQAALEEAKTKLDNVIDKIKNTPTVYLEMDGKKVTPEDNTFVLTSLDEGIFKIANIPDDAYVDWNCVEEVVWENPETFKTERWWNFWINENGTYQPHGAKVMDAVATIYENAGRKTKIATVKFKIDTRVAGVSEIKVVNGEGKKLEKLQLSGKEWATVKAKGKLNDEWINLPAQAFVIEPQKNIHTQGNRFCLWTPDHDFTIKVSMIDNADVSTTFIANTSVLKAKDFDVVFPSGAVKENGHIDWVIDKWDHMTNAFIGIRFYADPSVDLGYHVNMNPATATEQSLIWNSQNKDVAEFSELHSSGIVPKTAGEVAFKVSHKDIPGVEKLYTIDFRYKTPLTGVNYTKEYEVISGDDNLKQLELSATPADATDSRFVWSVPEESKDILTVESALHVNGETGTAVEKYTLIPAKGLTKDQEVIITGTPIDKTGGCDDITVKVIVKADPSTAEKEPAESETTKPETTKPETTEPETTKPETTKPETTKPGTTPAKPEAPAKPVVKVEKDTAKVTPETVKEAAKTGLVVELENNMKVEYSKEAMAEIAKQLPSDAINVEVKLTEARVDTDLNKAQQEAVKKAGNATVFSISLDVTKADGTVQNIHNFNGGKSTITVDYKLKDSTKTVEVYRVEENGTMKLMNTTFKDGRLSWVTDGHSYYAAVEVAKTAASGSSSKNGAPKTGDTENMAMWALLLLGALAATPVVRRRVNK